MPDQTIAFIGGGNMATSLIGGLVADGTSGERIWVADPLEEKLAALSDRFGVHTTSDATLAAARADTVVLAVKPQNMAEVAHAIGATVADQQPLVVSIAAGVREDDIGRWLGCDAAIVRTMPNTPALVRTGATALHANRFVSAEQRSRAEAILQAVGTTTWVESEALLDAVTAVSGSGPAYYFLLMELMEDAGVAMGLDRATARALTLQTALGAARIAIESDDPPGVLREKVTSPGGTTEQALAALRAGGIAELVPAALEAARARAAELGDLLGKD